MRLGLKVLASMATNQFHKGADAWERNKRNLSFVRYKLSGMEPDGFSSTGACIAAATTAAAAATGASDSLAAAAHEESACRAPGIPPNPPLTHYEKSHSACLRYSADGMPDAATGDDGQGVLCPVVHKLSCSGCQKKTLWCHFRHRSPPRSQSSSCLVDASSQ